jgi:hypothetical protein
MNTETVQMIEKLRRLVFQVEGAITLIEAGCVQPDPHYKAVRETPNRIAVGDFIVTDRFTEPQA